MRWSSRISSMRAGGLGGVEATIIIETGRTQIAASMGVATEDVAARDDASVGLHREIAHGLSCRR